MKASLNQKRKGMINALEATDWGMARSQSKRVLAVLALLVLVIGSALGVVYSSYQSRQLFAELQGLNREAIHLEEDWGRLLLEQSTWASHARIEQVARSQLEMVVPDSDNIVVVEQ